MRKGEERHGDSHDPDPTGGEPTPPAVPVMALRTYTALRLGSVGVIAVLAIAIIREYHSAGDCLQGSISAYYYTPVQSVFVGTLLALGLVMIVLWGKTAFEDGFLNLAGLLAPVVAFVPTSDTNRCGIADAEGNQVDSTVEKNDVIAASQGAISNNMFAYLVVVGSVLALVLLMGIVAYRANWASITEHPVAYWAPWALALGLWVFGSWKFWQERTWIDEHAHDKSAKTMFVFIGLVVLNIGIQKWTGRNEPDGAKSKPWAITYWVLAALMVVGLAIPVIAGNISADFHDHRTFWLEAWEILLLAAFWGLQTWDRLNQGAPPRTDEEEQRMAVQAGSAP